MLQDMSSPIDLQNIQEAVIQIRGQDVILDWDVARIYGVETRRVNEAVRNNPDKFPSNYILKLNKSEWTNLKSEISTSSLPNLRSKNSTAKIRTPPKAFTEKGLYMLATILKSKPATAATLAIIETFTKLRHLSGHIQALSNESNPNQQKSLMRKSGQLMAEILEDAIVSNDSETSIELNFAVLKFKHTVSRKK